MRPGQGQETRAQQGQKGWGGRPTPTRTRLDIRDGGVDDSRLTAPYDVISSRVVIVLSLHRQLLSLVGP